MTVTVNTGDVEEQSGPETTVTSWTIDELAAASSVPSRTIREYQTFGILMAPVRVGRRGMYSSEHRSRLALIARLQARGYSLAGIKDLLVAWSTGASLAGVLDGVDATESFRGLAFDEMPTEIDPAELDRLIGDEGVDAALRAGLVQRVDGRIFARSPALLALVADAVDHGVAADAALSLVSALRTAARAQARAVAQVFVAELIETVTTQAGVDLARRSRFRLAQAAGSLLIDELAAALLNDPDPARGPAVAALIDGVRVGAIHLNQEQS